MEKIFRVEGMHCERCSARVEKALSELGFNADIDLEKGEVKVIGENIKDSEIKERIEELGFEVK